MIQRQQTLWLVLATAAAILSFMFPFAMGNQMRTATMPEKEEIIAGGNFFLVILTSASLILSIIIIFLFKNRKQQLKLCLLGILLSVGIIIVYILQMRKLIDPTPALYCVLPFLVLIGYFMAFRGIRRDEKLIKTLDKLR